MASHSDVAFPFIAKRRMGVAAEMERPKLPMWLELPVDNQIKWSAERLQSHWSLLSPYEFRDSLVASEVLPL